VRDMGDKATTSACQASGEMPATTLVTGVFADLMFLQSRLRDRRANAPAMLGRGPCQM